MAKPKKEPKVEDWRDIPGVPNYQANFDGTIRRIFKTTQPRPMKPFRKVNKKQWDHVKISINGKAYDIAVHILVGKAFYGEPPEGYCFHHVSADLKDNCVTNIKMISKSDLGRITGGQSRRKTVIKKKPCGEIVDFYSSARECAKENYFSHQTILDRCNGIVKSEIASDGFIYEYDEVD